VKRARFIAAARLEFLAEVTYHNEAQPMEALKDASHLYELERRQVHAQRPGFRINELQISPTQKVPWHFHTRTQDTFYVLEGRLRLFLREPKEEVRLAPGETYTVRPGRPHLVTNGGDSSATFLVLQGIGEYDYVPLVEPKSGS
jgi:quercetin dioxygenase-like cupin family protein